MTTLELGRNRLEDLRAEARTRAALRAFARPHAAARVRNAVGTTLIAIGAWLTQERVARTPRGCGCEQSPT